MLASATTRLRVSAPTWADRSRYRCSRHAQTPVEDPVHAHLRSRLNCCHGVGRSGYRFLRAGLPSGVAFTGSVNDADVRLINALTAQALDFLVDGQVAATGTAFGAASPYVGVSPPRTGRRPAAASTVLVDFTRDLASGGSFSLIPAPGLSQFGALFIQDDPTPAAGRAKPCGARCRRSWADFDLRDRTDGRHPSQRPRSLPSFSARHPRT
jgi:hypothetical protein